MAPTVQRKDIHILVWYGMADKTLGSALEVSIAYWKRPPALPQSLQQSHDASYGLRNAVII